MKNDNDSLLPAIGFFGFFIILIGLIVWAMLVSGCDKETQVTDTEPIGAPRYPTEWKKASPTPAPVLTGWPKIQTERWNAAKIRPEKVHFVEATAAQLMRSRTRYDSVAATTGVPWQVVASIHSLEASGSFREHLHNGDPLGARTRHVPAGRPIKWLPPYDWESSAEDALHYDHLDMRNWRSGIALELQNIELYNGSGYQKYHPETPSPYIWAGTTIEKRGKYISDGRWSPTAVSDQIGVAALLKKLQ